MSSTIVKYCAHFNLNRRKIISQIPRRRLVHRMYRQRKYTNRDLRLHAINKLDAPSKQSKTFSDWPDGLLATFISCNVCTETVKQKFNERTIDGGALVCTIDSPHTCFYARAAGTSCPLGKYQKSFRICFSDETVMGCCVFLLTFHVHCLKCSKEMKAGRKQNALFFKNVLSLKNSFDIISSYFQGH